MRALAIFLAAFFATNVLVPSTENSDAVAAVEHQANLDATAGQYAIVAPTFTGSNGTTSYLRLVNNGGEATGVFVATTYTIKVVGSPSGVVYGTATFTVPANASVQYSISEILTGAGVAGLTGGDTAYSLYIQDPDKGTGFMHVIYNGANGFFENLSACQNYVAADSKRKFLFNMHTSVLASYPTTIYMHNYSPTAVTYMVTVSDARTGTSIGSVNVQAAGNETVSKPMSYFEQQLGWTPNANQQHANLSFQAVGLTVAPILVEGVIFNQLLSASINMSAICSINDIVTQ